MPRESVETKPGLPLADEASKAGCLNGGTLQTTSLLVLRRSGSHFSPSYASLGERCASWGRAEFGDASQEDYPTHRLVAASRVYEAFVEKELLPPASKGT